MSATNDFAATPIPSAASNPQAQLSAALARARLLAAIGREINAAGDISTILDRVLAHLADVLHFRGGSIALIDDGVLRIAAAHGTIDEAARSVCLPVGEGIAGWVAAHGLAYRSDDIDAGPIEPAASTRQIGTNKAIRSYLAVPLIVHGKTLGILQIDSMERAAFTAEDQELLQDVALHIATAVERARLQEIVREQARQLEAQNDELQARAAQLAARNEELAARNRELEVQRAELAQRTARIEELVEMVGRHAAELEATIASISDGVWIMRRYGSLLTNRAGLAMYGLEEAGPIRSIEDALALVEAIIDNVPATSPEDLPISRALQGTVVTQCDATVTNRATGKRLTVSVSSAPIYDPAGTIVGSVSVHRDMTRFMEMQKARDEFISVISHDLRTPVTSIKGLVQLTVRRLRRNSDIEQALDGLAQTEAQVDRLASLVNDLLDVNRIQGNRLEMRSEPLELVGLVREAVQRLQTTTEAHRLLLDAPDQAIWVTGDARRIDQILDNLLSNAIKYSPHGGDIAVVVRREGDNVVTTVRDCGIGVPEADRAHLFERFGRASNATTEGIPGFGLGLFISREIAERHGGRLWLVDSGPTGSTFALSLPVSHAPHPA